MGQSACGTNRSLLRASQRSDRRQNVRRALAPAKSFGRRIEGYGCAAEKLALRSGALTLQSQLLIRQGKATDAVHVLEQVVKNSPDNAAAHFQLGMAYAATQNMGQAESEWRQASKLQPGMVEPIRALAALAMRRGDESLLEETGGKLMMLEPRSPDGYVLHGHALLMKKDQAGAEADLKRAISVAPDSAVGYARMGDLRAIQRKLTKPRSTIPKRCSEIHPLLTR